MDQNEKDPLKLTLPDVRLSFPCLWTPEAMEEGKEPQFEATFLFDNGQHAKLLDYIDELLDRVALNEWKKKVNFKRCLRDGNERSDTDGYGDGTSFLCARNKSRPGVVDRRLNPTTEADGLIYGGCYVNATVRFFAWEHKTGGKGVSAQLRAVQYLREGVPFGAGPVDATKEFEALDSDDATGAPTGTNTRSRSGGGSGGQRSGGKPASSNLDDY